MKSFIKNHRTLTRGLGIAALFLAAYWGAFHYVPPMQPGEKKIGVVISDIDSYKSSLIIYNQDLKRKRQKSLKSFKHAGLGLGCYRQPISDRHFFLEANGIFGMASIEDFISIDMEKETVAAYPVSTKMGLLGVAANQDYAYSLTNLNFESIIAQHSRSDRQETFKVNFKVYIELLAASERYVFAGATDSFRGEEKYCRIYVLDAKSLQLLRIIDLTEYGLIYGNNYLLTADSLYIPLVARQREDEKMPFDNNKVVKISLEDFSYSVIELACRMPGQMEKRKDSLFVLHEYEEEGSGPNHLTVYNETTGKQTIYILGDVYWLDFAISGDELYLLGIDEAAGGYFCLHRYAITDDAKLTLEKKQIVPIYGYVAGMYVYEKEEAAE